MALNPATCGYVTEQALSGARIVCLTTPESVIQGWLQEFGARVVLWSDRVSLTDSMVRDQTRDACAIVIDLDLGISPGFHIADMVAPLCGVLFTAESLDLDTCRRIHHAHWGYRSKRASREDFVLATRRLAHLCVPDIARIAARAVSIWKLSPQQARVLYYDLWSYCDQDIADALDLSIHTVQEYQEELRRKTGARGKQAYLARLLEVSGTPPPLSPVRRQKQDTCDGNRALTRSYTRSRAVG